MILSAWIFRRTRKVAQFDSNFAANLLAKCSIEGIELKDTMCHGQTLFLPFLSSY